MNIKEAIAEIEKRYKVGDKIPCLAYKNDIMDYEGINRIEQIEFTNNNSVWVRGDSYLDHKLYYKGEWSEPIREEKNLWNFFKSIEDHYPNVAEKYLRNFDFEFIIIDGCANAVDAFAWDETEEGFDYWESIKELYEDYLKD